MKKNTELVLNDIQKFVGKTMVSKAIYDNPALPDEVVKELEKQINEIVDIPWIPEFVEGIAINKLLKLIDGFISRKLKPEFHIHYMDLVIAYAEGGIDAFGNELVRVLNIYIDIPVLDEEDEAELIKAVIDILISFIPNKV